MHKYPSRLPLPAEDQASKVSCFAGISSSWHKRVSAFRGKRNSQQSSVPRTFMPERDPEIHIRRGVRGDRMELAGFAGDYILNRNKNVENDASIRGMESWENFLGSARPLDHSSGKDDSKKLKPPPTFSSGMSQEDREVQIIFDSLVMNRGTKPTATTVEDE
mmetsp:Transcript_13857/g.32905  ORF Transcript_13857/g.32905 Transcript_13857/m.32905 type:complete len:162 (-) Transcript_13857:108-593(-)